jgi:putative ABC transport system substrate-binding protein
LDKRRIKRLFRIVLAILAILILESCSEKKAPRNYRVGILCGLEYIADAADGFKEGMAALGYIEDKNIAYDFQKTNFQPDLEERILKTFVKENVDLILTFPTEVSIMAKQVTQGTNIPVIFIIANIEGSDLVESIRHPGGHITGIRYPGPDLAVKRFDIMLDLAPNAKRLWIPYQRGYPIVASQMDVLYKAAVPVSVELIEFPASNADELQAELDARAESGDIGMDAILFIAEPLAVTPDAFGVMGKFAFEHKIPIGGAPMAVGGYESLFGVHVISKNVGYEASFFADKILKGTWAGSIPVASAESHIIINYRAADKLGIKVSEGLLRSADEIIR